MYLNGGTRANIPEALDDYGQAIVRWRTKSIVAAIEGKNTRFEDPNGTPRYPVHTMATSSC